MSIENPTIAANESAQNLPARGITDQYCAVISKQQREDPIGTAPHYARYLLIEIPLPWESNVTHSRHFPEGLNDVLARCAEQSDTFRFLAFCSDTRRSPSGYVRLFFFDRPAFPCAAFRKREYVVAEDRLNALVESLLQNNGQLPDFDDALQPTKHIRELFVCTHGARDKCCGTFGFPIYRHIEDHYAAASGGNIRVWRTSHIGGHRFAPTLIDFPEGRFWAHATPDMLRMLIERKGSFAEISRHYRGWGMIGRYEQAAERELFLKFGWNWIDYDKDTQLIDSGEPIVRVRIRYRSPDGECGEYNAEVEIVGKVQIGGCGNEWSETNQYRVRQLPL